LALEDLAHQGGLVLGGVGLVGQPAAERVLVAEQADDLEEFTAVGDRVLCGVRGSQDVLVQAPGHLDKGASADTTHQRTSACFVLSFCSSSSRKRSTTRSCAALS